jgi:hypothetical protein
MCAIYFFVKDYLNTSNLRKCITCKHLPHMVTKDTEKPFGVLYILNSRCACSKVSLPTRSTAVPSLNDDSLHLWPHESTRLVGSFILADSVHFCLGQEVYCSTKRYQYTPYSFFCLTLYNHPSITSTSKTNCSRGK